jgi:hypothetical protein
MVNKEYIKGITNWEQVYNIQNWYMTTKGQKLKRDITEFWSGHEDWPGLHHLNDDYWKSIFKVVKPLIHEGYIKASVFQQDAIIKAEYIINHYDNPSNPSNTLDIHEKTKITFEDKSIKSWEWRLFMTLRELWEKATWAAKTNLPPKNILFAEWNNYENAFVAEYPVK